MCLFFANEAVILSQGLKTELKRLGLIAGLCVLLGWLVPWSLVFVLLVGAGLYLGVMLWQMRRLNLWLVRTDDAEQPPEASGIWGEVFDNIYHLQRRKAEEKANLQAVINRVQETTSALKDGIILLDWRGHLDFWNPAAQRLLGFNAKDQGLSVIHFVRHPRFVSYFEDGDYSEPLALPSPRFASKQLQFQITRFGKNERLIVVRDVTQLHNLEQMRQDFVANVSHELRTPLTVINGYLETMADNNTAAVWTKPLQQMQQQAQRMSLLIHDLIMLSRLETTESSYNQQDILLAPLLIAVRNEAAALGNEKSQSIILESEPDLRLRGTEKEIHSAFSNLVINAVKYTPEHGKIVMRLWGDQQHIYFSVSDNGPGIEQKHLSRLTERFYRVDPSRNSSTGGTGLGLAIVKHVLLRHDAELKITSEQGKGSVFTCVFPLPS
jgi:two-component system phosphate regulon sensor histidine kinase PhoR